jgi:3-oxoacyl-[acyl-carrier protein] reductase
LINTDIIKTVPEKQMQEFLKSIPMHRIGEPEEVASLAAFLASDEAAYISGQCIKITGGMN